MSAIYILSATEAALGAQRSMQDWEEEQNTDNMTYKVNRSLFREIMC